MCRLLPVMISTPALVVITNAGFIETVHVLYPGHGELFAALHVQIRMRAGERALVIGIKRPLP